MFVGTTVTVTSLVFGKLPKSQHERESEYDFLAKLVTALLFAGVTTYVTILMRQSVFGLPEVDKLTFILAVLAQVPVAYYALFLISKQR